MADLDAIDAGVLSPFEHRGVTYPNRIVFSPLTRARASSEGMPGLLQAEYYRQRASAAIQVSEAIAVVPEGRGGAWTPGLHTDEHAEAWRLTTDAVHGAGGRIFAQLWHAGRLAHSSFAPDGRPPASPVAKGADGKAVTEAGRVPYETPRALTVPEIEALVADYGRAADRAMRAGFDGIELHGAHGYLLDSFLRDTFNDRDDAYGGSIENRARFLVEVLERMVAVAGGDRVALRLSPNTTSGGMIDSDPAATFGHVIDRMNRLGVAWLDLVEGNNLVEREVAGGADTDALARGFDGAVILNHAYTREMADEAIAAGRADMIAFGRPFIANPDLVERFRNHLPLATSDRDVWYGGGAEGLIDFPAESSREASASAETAPR